MSVWVISEKTLRREPKVFSDSSNDAEWPTVPKTKVQNESWWGRQRMTVIKLRKGVTTILWHWKQWQEDCTKTDTRGRVEDTKAWQNSSEGIRQNESVR